MTPQEKRKADFLKQRQTRTHYAIKSKRLLGHYVPPSGPVESGTYVYNRMRNELINARAGIIDREFDKQNLFTSLKSTNDLERTFEIYCDGGKIRQRATARRIAHRLGYIDERETDHERHMKKMAETRNNNEYQFNVGMDVRAYGSVTVKARNLKAAIAKVTPEYVAKNFEPNGGSEDIAYDHPFNIALFGVTEDWEDLDDFSEIDLPNPEWAPRCSHCDKIA